MQNRGEHIFQHPVLHIGNQVFQFVAKRQRHLLRPRFHLAGHQRGFVHAIDFQHIGHDVHPAIQPHFHRGFTAAASDGLGTDAIETHAALQLVFNFTLHLFVMVNHQQVAVGAAQTLEGNEQHGTADAQQRHHRIGDQRKQQSRHHIGQKPAFPAHGHGVKGVAHAALEQIAKENVAVRLDFSDLKNVPESAKAAYKQYKVLGFPTLLVLDGEGKEKGRIVGPAPEKKFFAQLKKFLKK